MTARNLKPDIFAIGAIDWHRTTFDALVPLPHGTSYNSYLVMGSEKTALIDTVEPDKWDELLQNIKETPVKTIDYLISLHSEQDHSGCIPKILELHPEAQILTSPKGKEQLQLLLHLPDDKLRVMADGETLSLGNKTLTFMHAPWVHWPDNMFCHVAEDKVLFTNDFLGAHLATDKLIVTDKDEVYSEAKRYFAEIMMPYRAQAARHLERVKTLDLDLIAPSHGPVFTKPFWILNAYQEWTADQTKNELVIAYVSMHESTRLMANYFATKLTAAGITVHTYDLAKVDVGELAIALVDATTLLIGASAVVQTAHPVAVYATALINVLRPKLSHYGIFGSFGWAAKIPEQLTGLLPSLAKAEQLPPLMVKGLPKEEDYGEMDGLVEIIVKKHGEKRLMV